MLAKGIEVDFEDSLSEDSSTIVEGARLASSKARPRRARSSKLSPAPANIIDNNLDSNAILADKKEQADSRVFLQRIARSTSKLASELALRPTSPSSSSSSPPDKQANKQTARGGRSIEIDKWSSELLASAPPNSEAAAAEASFRLPSDCLGDIDRAHIVASCDNNQADSCAIKANELHSSRLEESPDRGIILIGCHLLTLICGLLLVLYLFDIVQRSMTNLLSKILGGGERRRSLASNSQQQQQQQRRQQNHQQQQQQQLEDPQMLSAGVAQSHSSSTLSLPRNTSPITGASSQRRSSRSSIHSVSALFISAFTGGGGGGAAGQSSMNNGRSMIAKNKDDAVIIASSSPTIIQKESAESSGGSTVVSSSTGSVSSVAGAGGALGAAAGSTLPLVTNNSNSNSNSNNNNNNHNNNNSSSNNITIAQSAGLASDADAELVIVDQALYESVRQLPLPAAGQLNVIAVAAAAANDPHQQHHHQHHNNPQQQQQQHHLAGGPSSFQSGGNQQLPTVSTQSTLIEAGQVGQPVVVGHAPLNTTNTMKQAPSAVASAAATSASGARKSGSIASVAAKRQEVIRVTELLLNALNQGDYETYSRLCDPHMTSFEPEGLGNLVDNMEYRRFCLDQARQLQFHQLHKQQIISHGAQLTVQQVAAAAAASAVHSALLNLNLNPLTSTSSSPNQNNPTTNNLGQQQQQQQHQGNLSSSSSSVQPPANSASITLSTSSAVAAAAAAAAATTTTTTTASLSSSSSSLSSYHSSSRRQYSLILNPSVYLIGDDAASIAYTKLSQLIDLDSGQLSVEQSEETRVWHKKDGNKWLCVHLHRSQMATCTNNNNNINLTASSGPLQQAAAAAAQFVGPQTNASLIRSVANQQQLDSLTAIHRHHQPRKSDK